MRTGVIAPYTERLQALPFVRRVEARPSRGGDPTNDGILVLSTARGSVRLQIEEKRSHLSRALASEIIGRVAKRARPFLLLAPYVSPPMAEALASHGVNFMDRAGNCYVDLGGHFVAYITGRRPEMPAGAARGFRAPAYRLLFTLLARPELVRSPNREIAVAADVSAGTVSNVLRRLKEERFVVKTRVGLQLVGASGLLDRWVGAYADLLRPQLLVGRYRPKESDPRRLEEVIEEALGASAEWAFGGSAAAYRLTGHFRGDETVVHLSKVPADLQRALPAALDPDGALVVVGIPAPTALDGAAPRTAHPLLVYAELLAAGTGRALEAAQEIRGRFIELP